MGVKHMKRKVLLAIIPTLLALSACSGINQKARISNDDFYKEDTLAHEEFFGNEELEYSLTLKQPLRAAEDIADPTIGVQFKNYQKEYKGQLRDYCAIRYVAAIASRHVKAEWIRGASMQDSRILKSKGVMESTVAYSSLNNGGTLITPDSLGGTCFVVYTLFDIPLFEYLNYGDGPDMLNCNWSYVAAGLKLTDLDNDDPATNYNMSNIYAVEIGNHHAFSFDEGDLVGDGYFIEGTIDGREKEVVALDGDVSGSTDLAKKTLDLNAGDKFGLFKWSETEFRFYGNFNCSYDKYYITLNESLSTNYSMVGIDSEYTLFLNDEGRFGLSPTSPLSIPTTIYLDLNDTVWDQNVTYNIAVWQTSKEKWVTPTSVTSKVYRFDNVDTDNQFLFVEYGEGDPNWSWGANCQTNNLTYDNADVFIMNDTYKITGWNDGGDNHAGVSRSSSIR